MADEPTPDTNPSANMPRVELPTAELRHDAALAAVANPFVSQAYVYLFLVADAPIQAAPPIAKIPLVLLPAADPLLVPTLEAVADPLVSQA